MKGRGGRPATEVIPNVRKATVHDVTLRNVEKGSTVSTDELASYALLESGGFVYGVVARSYKQYAWHDDEINETFHTNGVESSWRQFKKSVASTHIHVSSKYMDDYLREFCFRSNHRVKQNAMFDLPIGAV